MITALIGGRAAAADWRRAERLRRLPPVGGDRSGRGNYVKQSGAHQPSTAGCSAVDHRRLRRVLGPRRLTIDPRLARAGAGAGSQGLYAAESGSICPQAWLIESFGAAVLELLLWLKQSSV